MRGLALLLALAGCGHHDDTEALDTADSGACGAQSTHDVTVVGKVVDGGGKAVSGASVELDERNWNPGKVYGTATTGADGKFTIVAKDVLSIEGCWGTALDYVLVATDGAKTAEDDVNSALYGAIEDGSGQADLTASPLVLD